MEPTSNPPSSRRCLERYVRIIRVRDLYSCPSVVNGFYSPLRDQIERAVSEGFITPANTSLIKFVDLESGDDEAKDWGRRAVEALESWVWDVSPELLGNDCDSDALVIGIGRLQLAVAGQRKISLPWRL
jgi:hypothetical protein